MIHVDLPQADAINVQLSGKPERDFISYLHIKRVHSFLLVHNSFPPECTIFPLHVYRLKWRFFLFIFIVCPTFPFWPRDIFAFSLFVQPFLSGSSTSPEDHDCALLVSSGFRRWCTQKSHGVSLIYAFPNPTSFLPPGLGDQYCSSSTDSKICSFIEHFLLRKDSVQTGNRSPSARSC